MFLIKLAEMLSVKSEYNYLIGGIKMNIEIFVKSLEEELKSLKESWNIEGVSKASSIVESLEDKFFDEIPILYNRRFEVVFSKDENKVEFRTTRSNQIIDQKYMNEMMAINSSTGRIESFIKLIIQFGSIEA